MRTMITRTLTLIVLATGLATPVASQPATSSGPDTRLFAMQSNLWVNLHHFLYVTVRARRGMDAGRASVPRSLTDTVGFGSLSSSARADWDQALDYYSRVLAER